MNLMTVQWMFFPLLFFPLLFCHKFPQRTRHPIRTNCWQQDRANRPAFARIIERMKGSVDFTFPKTDLSAYKEFQGRLAGERVPDPRPVEMIDRLCDRVGWDDVHDA
jgi:hypothetical protein